MYAGCNYPGPARARKSRFESRSLVLDEARTRIPLIPILFGAGCPLDITKLVVAVVIDPFNGQIGRRF
jgi:hypothetical protein